MFNVNTTFDLQPPIDQPSKPLISGPSPAAQKAAELDQFTQGKEFEDMVEVIRVKQLAVDQPSALISGPSPASQRANSLTANQDVEGMVEVIKAKQSTANQVADLEAMGVKPLNKNYDIAARQFAAKRLTKDGFRVSRIGKPQRPSQGKAFIRKLLKF